MTHKYLIVYLQCHHPPCFFNLCNPFHFPPWQHWSRLAALDIPWICLPHNFEVLRRPGDAVSPRSPRGYLRWEMERKEMENMGGIEFLLALLLMGVESSQTIWGWYCIPWRQFEFRSFQQFRNYHLRLQNHDRFNITNIQKRSKRSPSCPLFPFSKRSISLSISWAATGLHHYECSSSRIWIPTHET